MVYPLIYKYLASIYSENQGWKLKKSIKNSEKLKRFIFKRKIRGSNQVVIVLVNENIKISEEELRKINCYRNIRNKLNTEIIEIILAVKNGVNIFDVPDDVNLMFLE